MMREIKFRLRDGTKIIGYERWHNGIWEHRKNKYQQWTPAFLQATDKDLYAGFKDKNGVEIYEWDKVRHIQKWSVKSFTTMEPTENSAGLIYYFHTALHYTKIEDFIEYHFDCGKELVPLEEDYEVIGKIYPEELNNFRNPEYFKWEANEWGNIKQVEKKGKNK